MELFLLSCPKCKKKPKMYSYNNHYCGFKCENFFSTHFDTKYGIYFEKYEDAQKDAENRWNELVQSNK